MESRKQTRLLAWDDSFVEVKGVSGQVGKIFDISPGGLSFSYQAKKTPVDGFKQVDIYLTQNEFRMSDVPCTIVCDTIDLSNGSNGNTCHRCVLIGAGLQVMTYQRQQRRIRIKTGKPLR